MGSHSRQEWKRDFPVITEGYLRSQKKSSRSHFLLKVERVLVKIGFCNSYVHFGRDSIECLGTSGFYTNHLTQHTSGNQGHN